MDNYWDRNRQSNYFLSMASLEANHLVNVATSLSQFHLKDALIRVRFQDEIREFTRLQIQTIRNSTSDDKCQECIQNLKQEAQNLKIQDRMLRTGEAVVSSSVKFYHDHEKVIGYVIDGIGVVLGTVQLVAGVGLFAGSLFSGNVIGVVAGSALIANGAGSMAESIDKLRGVSNPTNPVIEAYQDVAEFFGFDKRLGLLAYQVVDLTTSYYGIFKLTLKPEAWRIFKYLPTDYYRQVQIMSKQDLALKGATAVWKGSAIGVNLYQMNHNQNGN